MQDKTPHNAPPRTASQPGPEPWACHLLGLIAPLTVLSGNITGGVATLAGTVLVLLVYPLLDLTRHPAHHLKPGLRFWQLQPYPDVASLPAGYYALFWPALVPLWRRLMDHRLPQRTLS
ncbi:MAG: hypothetical protein CL394_03270 [Acidiferrobacteraceae bacterium]|jgi:hypothetical protein|nr:hypothetical protein [Acidiferrobacteraceae bacterium]MDP7563255.1 hypothetical protein [Arenicellales bacterium]